MSISELSDNRFEEWNAFVQSRNEGTFFHLAQWKTIIEQSFGCQTFYMIEESAGAITGILPLALVKRPVFGPVLISNPLCVHGGGLGECNALIEAAAQKADQLGVEYLELRNSRKNEQDWPISDRFFTFERPLSEDNEENLKAIPRKQRAEVRKGIKANLKTKRNQDIESFFKVYATSVRNLGTPVFSKKYLKNLIEIFGDQCEITSIYSQENLLTSVLSFKYQNRILPYYGGGYPEARNYSAYPYMYWKVMERAAEEGYRVFDFGRSMKDSGAYSFKKNFGFDPAPLSYQYHLVRAKEMPDMDPDNPRNKFIVNMWKKLPVPIANKIGPFLYPVIM